LREGEDAVTTPAAFTVSYDDMYYMQLWCTACLEAGKQGEANLLGGEPGNRWDTGWPLERLNELAAAHLEAVHPPAVPREGPP
jgi:hypothetical protein